MERSKYISYKRERSVQKRRPKVVQGSFEDRNRYYKCVNCGFIFDIEQTTMGGDRAGNYTSPPENPVYNESGGVECFLSINTPFDVGGVCKLDSSGEVIEPVTLGYHMVSNGCPLCGNTANF
jgi:predicted RNA-binding Zn-ribbon protein involved in translation (DUF1610 family)